MYWKGEIEKERVWLYSPLSISTSLYLSLTRSLDAQKSPSLVISPDSLFPLFTPYLCICVCDYLCSSSSFYFSTSSLTSFISTTQLFFLFCSEHSDCPMISIWFGHQTPHWHQTDWKVCTHEDCMYIAHASSLYTWYLLRIVLNCLLLSSFHYSILLNSILLFYFISLLPSFFPLLSPLPLFYFPSLPFSPPLPPPFFLLFSHSLFSLFWLLPLFHVFSPPLLVPLLLLLFILMIMLFPVPTHHTTLCCLILIYSTRLNSSLFYSTLLNLFQLPCATSILLYSNLLHSHLINIHITISPFETLQWYRANGRSRISVFIWPYLRHFQSIQPISRDEP